MAVEHCKLVALFAFNPTLGGELTEGKKILYFHPRLPSNVQKQYVGISEGMINFCSDFAGDQPLRITRSQKHRYAFFRCEPDFWLVMVVSNPVRLSKDRKTVEEYLDDTVDETVLQFVLSRCYHLFRMFNGPLQKIVDSAEDPETGMNWVRRRLDLFMKVYMPTVHAYLSPTHLDINGFKFLPANKPTFLTIQYLINLVLSNFSSVHSISVMYQDKLVWSGLSQHDMILLYKFHNELRAFYTYCALNEDLEHHVKADPNNPGAAAEDAPGSPLASPSSKSGGSDSEQPPQQHAAAKSRANLNSLAPGFLTGPQMRLLNPDNSVVRPWFVSNSSPRIHLTDDGSCGPPGHAVPASAAGEAPSTVTRLVVYEKYDITLYLVLNDPEERPPASPRKDPEPAAAPVAPEAAAEPSAPDLEQKQQQQQQQEKDRDEEDGRQAVAASDLPFRPPQDFYAQLEGFIAKNFAKLARMLKENASQSLEGQDGFSVLYFNHMNLAFKPSLKCHNSKLVDMLKLIRMMHQDFANSSDSPDSPTEVYVKTRQDCWVVGRRASECRREFFMIVEDKSTLGEVQQEVERLEKTLFGKIFIH